MINRLMVQLVFLTCTPSRIGLGPKLLGLSNSNKVLNFYFSKKTVVPNMSNSDHSFAANIILYHDFSEDLHLFNYISCNGFIVLAKSIAKKGYQTNGVVIMQCCSQKRKRKKKKQCRQGFKNVRITYTLF